MVFVICHFPKYSHQVDEIEALQSKCKQGVKNHSKRLKEISLKLKTAISEDAGSFTKVVHNSPKNEDSSNLY